MEGKAVPTMGSSIILDFDNAESISLPSLSASTTKTYTPTKNGMLHLRGWCSSSGRVNITSANISYNDIMSVIAQTKDHILNKGETYTISLTDEFTNLVIQFIPFKTI